MSEQDRDNQELTDDTMDDIAGGLVPLAPVPNPGSGTTDPPEPPYLPHPVPPGTDPPPKMANS